MALLSTVSRSNWNLEILVFAEGGKLGYPEKSPRSRDENQQQTQNTFILVLLQPASKLSPGRGGGTR